MAKKRILMKEIEKLDRRGDTSFIRELEMTLDSYAKNQGYVLQFFEDLRIYGLDEAILYVEGYVRDGNYNEKVLPELREIAERIKSIISGYRQNPAVGIESFRFPKGLTWTLSEAKQWLRMHGYRTDKYTYHPYTYIFEQSLVGRLQRIQEIQVISKTFKKTLYMMVAT